MNNNHPNRNWRRRLNTAADQWLTTHEAELLTSAGGVKIRSRIRMAYLAGLRDGERRQCDLATLDSWGRKNGK